jgi:hypothetical protein
MKVGDMVRVKQEHWSDPGAVGIIVSAVRNSSKGFYVLLSSGQIRPKLRKSLEALK